MIKQLLTVHLDKEPFCLVEVRSLMHAAIKSCSKVALPEKCPLWPPVAAAISAQHMALLNLDLGHLACVLSFAELMQICLV